MTPEPVENIKERAIGASKWGALTLVLPRVITPLITVALAYFLTPEDYGVVAIMTLIVGLATVFQGMAIGQTLIQTEDRLHETANACFWLSAGTGLVISIAIFVFTPLIASFFNDPKITTALRLQCWMVLFSSLASVPEALLKREFRYDKLIPVTVAPTVVLFLVGVPMAAYGFGYWSLVVSALAGTVLRCTLAWSKVLWRPNFVINTQVTKHVLRFGGLIAIDGFCGWIFNYGDNAVLGHFLGVRDLGLYVFAYSIVMCIGLGLSSPIASVSYSMLCRLQKNDDELVAAYKKGIELIAAAIFPAFFGLCLVADVMVPAIFGNKWEGLAPVLSILCIHPGLTYALSLNSEVYKAKGRPDIVAKIHVISIIYLIPVYLISVRFGLISFCFGRFSMIISWFPHAIIIARLLGVKPSFMWECIRFPLLSSLIMCIVISPLIFWPFQHNHILIDPWIRLVLSVALGVSTYTSVYYFFNRQFTINSYRLVVRAIRPS